MKPFQLHDPVFKTSWVLTPYLACLEGAWKKESGVQWRQTRGCCALRSFLHPFLPSACYAGYTV